MSEPEEANKWLSSSSPVSSGRIQSGLEQLEASGLLETAFGDKPTGDVERIDPIDNCTWYAGTMSISAST
jgi:hypothetical protein